MSASEERGDCRPGRAALPTSSNARRSERADGASGSSDWCCAERITITMRKSSALRRRSTTVSVRIAACREGIWLQDDLRRYVL